MKPSKRPNPSSPAKADDLPRSFGGLTVRDAVSYDFALLRKLGSPLFAELDRVRAGEAAPQDVSIRDEHGYEMIALFTMPPREAARIINSEGGVAKFREMAIDRVACSLGPLEVFGLMRCIERDLLAVFSRPDALKQLASIKQG